MRKILSILLALLIQGCSGDEITNVTNVTNTSSDPGIPRIIWGGIRTITVFGQGVLLDEFRYAGHATGYSTDPKRFPQQIQDYRYDDNIEGISYPTLSSSDAERTMWLAVFAVAPPDDEIAQIRFMPFLRVSSFSATTGEFAFNPYVGELTPGFFVGGKALVCTEGALIRPQVFTVTGNTASTVTLDPVPSGLEEDDYVLLAPGPSYVFKYLRTLQFDYSPSYAGQAEWRNFVINGNRTYSRIGRWSSESNPEGDITRFEEPREVLDFRHRIGPLATGLIGNGQVFRTDTSGDGAYLKLSHDSGNHDIVLIGIDRTDPVNQGISAPFEAGFGRTQKLYALVNGQNVTGRVVIEGWSED